MLDNEEEIASATGRGHVVIPVHIVRRDRTGAEEDNKHRKKGVHNVTMVYHACTVLLHFSNKKMNNFVSAR